MPVVLMTPDHPQWDEFITKLEGPEGCDFRDAGYNDMSFLCMSGGPYSHVLTASIIMRMNRDKPEAETIDIPATVDWLKSQGGCCDCEVMFNVEGPRNAVNAETN